MTMLECIEEDPTEIAKKLTANNGTIASLHSDEHGEKISIHNKSGLIIVEYYPETQQCHIQAPQGDLFLNAPTGSISLSSGENINLKCPGDIVIEGDNKIELRSGILFPDNAHLSLKDNEAKLYGRKVAINAEQGDFSIVKSRLRTRSFAGKIDRARVSLSYLELLAETMHQKNKTFYQSVENLLQINAGKMRTLVRGLFNLKGKRTYLKADKDMKLKGDKIHLR